MSGIRFVSTAIMLSVLAACSQAHVQTVQPYDGSSLARPDRVLVSYFAISPDQVQLNRGIFARIRRSASDESLTDREMEAARDTQAAIAKELVDRLKKYGLPAELATGGAAPSGSLLVQGQIVALDQGNRARRVLIGLGAGRSSVSADAQLYYASGSAAPRFLTSFEGKAESGRAPGAAETMGVGGVAGRLGTSAALTGAAHAGAERRGASDTAEATRLADGLAKQIGEFAVARGWIPPTAIQ